MAEPRPRWRWVAEVRRYRNLKTGRFVSAKQVRIWTEDTIAASADRAAILGHLLGVGRIDLPTWHQGFRDLVRREIVKQYLAGRGGEQALSLADRGRISAVCRDQWKYMDKFANEISAGTLFEPEIVRRMRMYVNSAREAYERAARIAAKDAQFDEVSWIMDPHKEHCTGDPGCLELSARSWQSTTPWPYRNGRKDVYPGTGDTPCLTNCGCHLDYRRVGV